MGVGVTLWILDRLGGAFLVLMTQAVWWYIRVLGMVIILEWISMPFRGESQYS